jgi:adenine deaminase
MNWNSHGIFLFIWNKGSTSMPWQNLNYLRSKTSRFDVIEKLTNREESDLIIRNGQLVNVFTREVLKADIVIYGDRIGFVGDASEFSGKEILDASGKFITPGLLDGHLHIDSCMVNVTNFAKGVIPLGTTSVFIDSHEIGNALGIEGVRMMVEEGKTTPLRVFQYVPAQVPCGAPENQTPNEWIGLEETKELYAEENVHGLGEVSKYRVIKLDELFVNKIDWILKQGGIVDGSCHDFTGLNLQAYVASGIFADHESVTKELALERARMGLNVMLREGTTEHNVTECIKAITEMGADPVHFSFCSDDRHPTDIVATGHINYCIRLAVQAGLDPVVAVQMATINSARNFRINNELGAIAPGKLADLLIVDDLKTFAPEKVFIGGVLVAENGTFLPNLDSPNYKRSFLNSIKISRTITADDFLISAPLKNGDVRVRVIEAIEGRIWSKAGNATLTARNHELKADPQKDVIKIAVVERYGKTKGPNIGLGFIKNFGLNSGALGQSIAQDKHDIVVIGVNEEDMALVVNAIMDSQGGVVVARGNKILGTYELPIGGILSDKTIEEVNEHILELSHIASKNLGCSMGNPFACLQFQTHPMIPFLKIADKGLMDVNNQRIVDVVVAE